MPRPIKYATATHSLTASATVSPALVGDGTAESRTPLGRSRLISIECVITNGSSLTNNAGIAKLYLCKDTDGRHPITDASASTILTPLGTAALNGFSLKIEQDAYIEGPIYVVCKLPTGDSGTGTWKLTFVQGG